MGLFCRLLMLCEVGERRGGRECGEGVKRELWRIGRERRGNGGKRRGLGEGEEMRERGKVEKGGEKKGREKGQ